MAQTSGLPDTPASVLLGGQGSYGIPLAQQLMNGMQPYREPAAGSRSQATGTFTPTSGIEYMVSVPMLAGDVITNITIQSNGALTMGSNLDGHLWFALRNPIGGLILQTADQGGSATWTGATWKPLALSGGPYTIPQTGLYLVTVMVNAGTGGAPAVPTYRGVTNSATFWGTGNTGQPAGQKAYAYSAGTSLTGTAPSTPTLAGNGNWFYCVTS